MHLQNPTTDINMLMKAKALNDQVLSSQTNTVKGIIKQQNGESLPGAIVVIQGTTIGTVADEKGNFEIGKVPDDGL